ncbi:peptide chain release factor 2 [Marispirochaeta sp.]|uniref:peptide chain release factor 2 n=1 Tax=Marispirochaeta sp. TaxID=2038653 RepID=UPI0029C70A29|nr:peptide chain release factor 2 [Marispirochaeta sp.]
MLSELDNAIKSLNDDILEIWGVFDPERIEHQIREREAETAEPDFWNDREGAEKLMAEITALKRSYEPWKELKQKIEDLSGLYAIALEEKDDSVEQELKTGIEELTNEFNSLRLMDMLSGEFDRNPVFLTIHSGAGGTEACDWVSMLYRMYSRWIERRGFKSEILDLQEAEGGIKSITLQVKGDYVHGYLKCETGIHRLVRISPFDSSSRRHTSFASVYVSPVIEDEIEVDIKPEDLRIDTYRAQGAGGQHVNKTDSAVRMTHLATGIVVQCQNERSQHKNRDMAMKMLKSRLYEYYKAEQEAEQEKKAQEKKDISWGNQIRSYVFHPYNMVKDHRTKHETGNVQAVMDGDLDPFIESYLNYVWKQKKE